MFTEHFCRKRYSLFRAQCAAGPHIKRQLVEVRLLTYTCVLHVHIDAVNRCVNGVHCDHADRLIIGLAFICTDITAAFCDRHLHVQLAVCTVQGCDHLIRILNLNIRINLYIGRMNDAFTFVFDVGSFGFIRVRIIADGKALQVHDDFGDILLHPGNRAEFMKDSVNLHLTDSRTRQR